MFADISPQAGAVFDSVESVAQKELAVVAAVRPVIDGSWLDATTGPWDREASDRCMGLEAEKGPEIFTQGPFHPPLTEASPDWAIISRGPTPHSRFSANLPDSFDGYAAQERC